jgi:hypothetical protein
MKKYYPKWNDFYLPEGEEEKREYMEIESAFE